MILGQLGIIIMGFADTIMIGHIDGGEANILERVDTDSLAAAGFVGGTFSLIAILGLGFSYGFLPVASRLFSVSEYKETGVQLKHALGLNLLFSLVIVLLGTVMYQYLDLFPVEERLLPLIKPYFRTQLVAYPFVMAFLAYKQYFDAYGKTWIGMLSILTGNALNIWLNYLLIFGHWGMPEWGLYGAGVATLVSRIASFLFLLIFFMLYPTLKDARRGFRYGRIERSIALQLAKMGLPLSLQMGVESAGFTVIVYFITSLGATAMAAHQIIVTISTLGFMIFYGISAATTVIVSQERELGHVMEIRKAAHLGFYCMLVVAGALIGFLLCYRHEIGYLFNNNPEVVAMVATTLIPLMLYQVGDALQILYTGVLRGLEDVNFLAKAAFFIHMMLAPTLAYTGGFCLGITNTAYQLMALWFAYPISLTLLGLVLMRRAGKLLRQMEREPKRFSKESNPLGSLK